MFDSFVGLAGRLLGYTNTDNLWSAAVVTGTAEGSGLIVRGRDCVRNLRQLRASGQTQLLVADTALWTNTDATTTTPMLVPESDGLFATTLDDWAASVISAGADVVLTRSLFVREGDWGALRAVLRVGEEATRPDVMTLVATDAAMLGPTYRPRFLDILARGVRGERPLAFVFADQREPLSRRERIAGLRALLAQHPASLLLATDMLAGTDVITRGGGAAVGVTSSLRHPARPRDDGGPPAVGWVPGLFLRQLWETRSPATYADWYADSPLPTCEDCGGRAMTTFTNHPDDKAQILKHNIHGWLAVFGEIRRRQPTAARDWLNHERRRALAAHADLRPRSTALQADRLLRSLCELDDPEQRRTTATGGWR